MGRDDAMKRTVAEVPRHWRRTWFQGREGGSACLDTYWVKGCRGIRNCKDFFGSILDAKVGFF